MDVKTDRCRRHVFYTEYRSSFINCIVVSQQLTLCYGVKPSLFSHRHRIKSPTRHTPLKMLAPAS